MPYEFLTNKEIDLKRLGYENASLQLDFDPEKSYLRITLFDNDHYQDHVTLALEDDFGNGGDAA